MVHEPSRTGVVPIQQGLTIRMLRELKTAGALTIAYLAAKYGVEAIARAVESGRVSRDGDALRCDDRSKDQ